MLHYRQQLNMRVAHVGNIGHEPVREFTVGERVAVGISLPRTDVQLIYIHRGGVYILPAAFFHPCAVRPLKRAELVYFRGGSGARLGVEGIGVAFHKLAPVLRDDEILVGVEIHEALKASLPETLSVYAPELKALSRPVVFVTGDENGDGMRSPYAEKCEIFILFVAV